MLAEAKCRGILCVETYYASLYIKQIEIPLLEVIVPVITAESSGLYNREDCPFRKHVNVTFIVGPFYNSMEFVDLQRISYTVVILKKGTMI